MTLYKMKEFAALAGVSVKALRHYERIGLLKPRRTPAGHRRYVQDDLGRVEAIGALKYVGFSLDQVRSILSRPGVELPKALAARRQALSELHNDKFAVHKLFEEIAPRYAERPGGYTRIVKLGPRRSDSAEMVFLELV